MSQLPKITIVTPSYNQGRFIAETIDSVVAQQYPNLEHIVMDGGSKDDTLEILKRYPHLIVVSEKDKGQADAINKGFARATGDIWGFLNSDDTFLPGALHRVAQEIDPAAGRHIVMGRCRFIDEHSRFSGIEHPSAFESHLRVLEIWKGHMLPQPSVFWTPEVWKRCGGMDLSLKFHLDYELFCRFSEKYDFHTIDQVLSTYRLHAESKTEAWTEADRLEDSINLSKRFWGPRWSPKHLYLAASLAAYRFDRAGRGRDLLMKGREAWRQHDRLSALRFGVAGGVLAPEVAFYAGVYPRLKDFAKGGVHRAMEKLADLRGVYPQTQVYFDHTEVFNDGWAGPRLAVEREGPGAKAVRVAGDVELDHLSRPFVLTVKVDGAELGRHLIKESGHFFFDLPLLRPAPAKAKIEVEASGFWVPRKHTGANDYRPLAWRPEVVILV